MRRHALQALLSASGNPFWHEDTPKHDLDDYCLWHGSSTRHSRQLATSLTQQPPGPAPPPGGAPAGGAADGEKKEEGGEDGATKIEYAMENGKTVMLCGDSKECCIKDCRENPAFSDNAEGQTGATQMMGAMSGGQQGMTASCVRFCDMEFRMNCFPGSSTVVVRDRGRIPLSSLRLGDFVLVLRFEKGHRVLGFEPVISWLHCEPDAEIEVVQVRHSMGAVSLTSDHLIFARRAGSSCLEAVVAQEVTTGDRVLAPWIDGDVSEPEVISIDHRMARGAYAPLTASGTLLVDGTAVSCYIAPQDLMNSPSYAAMLNGLKGLTGKESAHDVAHALMLPVRLLHKSTTQWRAQFGDVQAGKTVQALEDKDEALSKQSNEECVHPYGMFLYVVCKSFIT